VHTKDLNYKGYTHHASRDDPRYEIKSDNRNGALKDWMLCGTGPVTQKAPPKAAAPFTGAVAIGCQTYSI
jgi:Hypervirulence associated proteins TUDOR domain